MSFLKEFEKKRMIKLCNISVVYTFEVWELVKRYVSKQIRCVKIGLRLIHLNITVKKICIG